MNKSRGISNAALAAVLIALVLIVALALSLTSSDDEANDAAPSVQTADLPQIALVDDARVALAATDEPGSWLTYGQTFEEQRFSPLSQINRETVAGLKLAWVKHFDIRHRLQNTPLVVDGTMYVSDPWNVTYALDARTGEQVWRFDPQVDRESVRYACCTGPMTRGLAVYRGKVYIAAFDGRVIAVDAAHGTKVWEFDTQHPSSVSPFTISGAPRVGGGKVYIGQSSSEFGVRGYVTALDAETGELAWRFYLVPGDPSQPYEHPELQPAAATWSGEWWKLGGGGTVWNSIVYDADFNTVYLGVGNGAPWPRDIRSPGGGDNLYLTSIVAVDPDTGRMKWHYQTTPADNWDYTATQDMVLADMEVDGVARKVLLQAPKNGFFYVIDRADGALLRAHPYGRVTWASHVDMQTGRPVENPDFYYEENPQWIWPGRAGAHNWQAMSFDAGRGVMYIPTLELPSFFALDEQFAKTGVYKKNPLGMSLGIAIGEYGARLMAEAGPVPEQKAYLKAFDPLTGETLWNIEKDNNFNGGVLATAGGLVFQGDGSWSGSGSGKLSAYDTDDGALLWEYEGYASISAPPITYAIDGTQYLAIMASADWEYDGGGKLLVFSLGGDLVLAEPPLRDHTIPEPPPLTASNEQLALGDQLYHQVCVSCHGSLGRSMASPRIVDLRRMSPQTHQAFQAIVLGGARRELGMRSFADQMNFADVEAVHQFVISKAMAAREDAEPAGG